MSLETSRPPFCISCTAETGPYHTPPPVCRPDTGRIPETGPETPPNQPPKTSPPGPQTPSPSPPTFSPSFPPPRPPSISPPFSSPLSPGLRPPSGFAEGTPKRHLSSPFQGTSPDSRNYQRARTRKDDRQEARNGDPDQRRETNTPPPPGPGAPAHPTPPPAAASVTDRRPVTARIPCQTRKCELGNAGGRVRDTHIAIAGGPPGAHACRKPRHGKGLRRQPEFQARRPNYALHIRPACPSPSLRPG